MEQGVLKWLTQTLHHFKRNPSKFPFIQFALLDPPKMGRNPNDLEKKSLKKCELLPGSHQSQDLRPRLIRCTDRAQTFHVFWHGPEAMPLEGCFRRFPWVCFLQAGSKCPAVRPPFSVVVGDYESDGSIVEIHHEFKLFLVDAWATFWGAWSSSAWSCFVLWGDQETENNGVKMSVYTMFHHISLHEVVQLVVSAHLEKDWLIVNWIILPGKGEHVKPFTRNMLPVKTGKHIFIANLEANKFDVTNLFRFSGGKNNYIQSSS